MSTVRRKTRRPNVVGGDTEEQQSVRRKRRKPEPRVSEEESTTATRTADEVLDEIAEESDADTGEQTLLFESSEVISEDGGLRFWGKRSSLQRLVASAGSYTSTQVNATRYMTEVTIRVNPEKSNRFISATGESEFDAGVFFMYDDFETSASEEFWFSIDASHLLTALDIIGGDSVTIELVPDEEDEELADLWILDSTSSGQNTNFKVTIPAEDEQPSVPDGLEDERIEFQPEAFLSAYASVERCRGNENTIDQVFSSINEEDGQPYIRFSATDRVHAATSRSWLDDYVGEKLKKINFNPEAINKALPHMSEGILSRMMVSSESDDLAEDGEDDDWDDAPSQTSQLVILETLDETNRAKSKIKLSTLIPSNQDLEAHVVQSVHRVLDSTTILVTVNYPKLAQAISNANRVHSLNPENESERTQTVYLVIDGDSITVRSHNVKRPDFGTKSKHKIEKLDDSGKHNEEYGQRDIIGLITTHSLAIIERFEPADMQDEAVLAFFKTDPDAPHLNGFSLLRKNEADEWNQDDDYPNIVTSIFSSADTSIYDD